MAHSDRHPHRRKLRLPKLIDTDRLVERISALRVEKGLFWGLIALVTLSPIPLGGNRPWAWALMQAAAFLLLAVWLSMWGVGRARPTAALRSAWPLLGLFLLWIAFQVAQTIPLPPHWVAALSPQSALRHAGANLIADANRWIPLSVDPYATGVAAMKSAAYLAVFILTLLLLSNRARVKTFAYAVVASALVLSVYGVLLHLGEVTHEWFGTTIIHGASASATYPNRNHFAGWLEMTLAVGIGLLIADLRDRRYASWKHFWRAMIETAFSPKIRLRLYLTVLVIALVTTHSRMGNTAFFSSLIIAGILGLVMARHAPRGTALLLASLIAIDLFIVGSWFGVEKLAKRIEQTTVQEYQERQDPSDFVFSQINDFPLFGSGAGTFYVVFPQYRGANVVAYYDYAHNDYAQMAAESGWIGFGLTGAMVLLSLGVALRAQWLRRDPLMRGMAFASIMGITAILIHSWVDFNLQIPANAQLFVVLMALAWVALRLDRKPATNAQNGRTPQADPRQS